MDQLCSNLKLLLKKTASKATMGDLERALQGDASQVQDKLPEATPSQTDDQVSHVWPPVVGEYVVVNFEDGWYVGEVKSEEDRGAVDVSYMNVKNIATYR